MGLDSIWPKCYKKYMKWLKALLNKPEKKRKTIIDRKEQALYRIGRQQFLKLKEKGLSIPIVSL